MLRARATTGISGGSGAGSTVVRPGRVIRPWAIMTDGRSSSPAATTARVRMRTPHGRYCALGKRADNVYNVDSGRNWQAISVADHGLNGQRLMDTEAAGCWLYEQTL